MGWIFVGRLVFIWQTESLLCAQYCASSGDTTMNTADPLPALEELLVYCEGQSPKCLQVLHKCLALLRKKGTQLNRGVLQILPECIPVSNECSSPKNKALLWGLSVEAMNLRKHFLIFTVLKTVVKPQLTDTSIRQTCLGWGKNNDRVMHCTTLKWNWNTFVGKNM